jgi:pSer/pThr/pTyr-binding forkhead associated (FHA) protein
VVLEAGQSRMRSVRPGEQLLVGTDPEAQVCLADPAVQPRHALIERRGNSWVVRDLQTASPSRLMDASGRIGPVAAETTIEAGQLLIGSVLVTLYPGQR